MAAARLGPPLQPEEPDQTIGWVETPHAGMLLREAVLDLDGRVLSESLKRVPLDRELQQAMEWARSKYWDRSDS